MLWGLVTNIASGIGQVFSAKYYVTQQLAQMQAHNLNRDKIIDKASKPSKQVIKTIFREYDIFIKANEWAWVKKKGEVYAIKITKRDHKKGRWYKDVNNVYRMCSKGMHYGVFPPTPAVEASLGKCEKVPDEEEAYMESLKEEMKKFVEGYASNLEYWVLTLEALLQDMAI